MKRGKKKSSIKKVNSRTLTFVLLAILVLGFLVYGTGFRATGKVVSINGEEISEQIAITKDQLSEGLILEGYNNYIRWVEDADYNVPVEDVFDDPEIVYVWKVANLGTDGVKRWYGRGYSEEDEAILVRNNWYTLAGRNLEYLEPGVKYGVVVREAPVTIAYSFE